MDSPLFHIAIYGVSGKIAVAAFDNCSFKLSLERVVLHFKIRFNLLNYQILLQPPPPLKRQIDESKFFKGRFK